MDECIKKIFNLIKRAEMEDLYKMDKYFYYDMLKLVSLNNVK